MWKKFLQCEQNIFESLPLSHWKGLENLSVSFLQSTCGAVGKAAFIPHGHQLKCSCSASDQGPCWCIWKDSGRCSKNLDSCAHKQDWEEVCGPALDGSAVWGINQQIEELSRSVYSSHINNIAQPMLLGWFENLNRYLCEIAKSCSL